MTLKKDNIREYAIWRNLLNGIHKKSDRKYAMLGGSGYTIDKKWLTFEGFIEDLGTLKEGHDGLKIAEGFKFYDKVTAKYSKIKRGRKKDFTRMRQKTHKVKIKNRITFTMSLSHDHFTFIKKQALLKSVTAGEAYNVQDVIREALQKAFPVSSQFDMFGDEK